MYGGMGRDGIRHGELGGVGRSRDVFFFFLLFSPFLPLRCWRWLLAMDRHGWMNGWMDGRTDLCDELSSHVVRGVTWHYVYAAHADLSPWRTSQALFCVCLPLAWYAVALGRFGYCRATYDAVCHAIPYGIPLIS